MADVFKATILFVDDEPQILDVLQRTFKNEVSLVLTCTNPLDVLDLMKKHPIDLAVLDLNMPGLDGIALYKKMKELRPETSVIFLTGHGDKASVQEAMRLGATNFVDKPYDKNFLKLAVFKALEKSKYETLLREILELFIHHYTDADFSDFPNMKFEEKERIMRAALGVAKLKIGRKKDSTSLT